MDTNIEIYNEFAEVAMLNKEHDPWRKRKDSAFEMAVFEVFCEGEYGAWWDGFVGVEFLGKIEWDNDYFERFGVRKIKDITVIAMVKNKYYNDGRTISPDCVIFK